MRLSVFEHGDFSVADITQNIDCAVNSLCKVCGFVCVTAKGYIFAAKLPEAL